MIDEQGEHGSRDDQEFDPECIMVVIIRGLELDIHEVKRSVRRDYEDQLHERIVRRYVCRDQVQVSCCVNDGEKYLRLS